MRHRNQIALELTPLLDVILTILFMVLISVTQQAQTAQADAEKALEEANHKIEMAEKKLTQLNQSAISLELLQDNCKVVTVTAYNNAEDDGGRRITIAENKDDPYEIEYDWSSLTYAKNSFKQTLSSDYLTLHEDEQIIFIVFQYDSKSIYNYDYTFINSVLTEMNTNNSHIYLAYYDMPLSVINDTLVSDTE